MGFRAFHPTQPARIWMKGRVTYQKWVCTPRRSHVERGIDSGCPTGKTPKVTSYSDQECSGSSIDAGTLPLGGPGALGVTGPCVEFLVKGVAVGAQSVKFTCT